MRPLLMMIQRLNWIAEGSSSEDSRAGKRGGGSL